MKNIWKSLVAMVGVIALSIHGSMAQDSGALIDALVKKGVLTDQEGEEIRAETAKDWAQTSASKINISSFIKNITLYGDLRLRFEDRQGQAAMGDFNGGTAVGSGGLSQERDRWRYRLRAGIKGDLYDNFFFGLRLSTAGGNQRSGNITFGTSSGTATTGGLQADGGPFSHNNGMGWDQLYLGWKPTDWLTLTAGQVPNPFYTTSLVWDDNLSPQGFSEQFSTKVFDKDTEVFANAGQFLYDAYQKNQSSQGNDLFLLEEQVGIKHHFTEDIYFKGAFGAMTYSGVGGSQASTDSTVVTAWAGAGNQPAHFNGIYTGFDSNSDSFSVNNIAVLEMPFEWGFKVCNLPMKVFGDFAYNLSGSDRSQAAANQLANNGGVGSTKLLAGATALTAAQFNSPEYQGLLNNEGSGDVKAYQIGMQFNELKKKGDWMGQIYWNHTEYFAVDPNLNDADTFDARQNMEGIIVKASYQITGGMVGSLRFADADRIDHNLGAPGTGQDLSIEPNHYQLVQADVVWKF